MVSLQLLRYVHALASPTALRRAAAAGSVWALLAVAFGGFYERPWQLPGVTARVAYTITLTLAEYVARGCRPLFDEWTLPFEIARAVVRCLMVNYCDRMLNPSVARFLRTQCDYVGSVAGFFSNRRLGTTTEVFRHNGLEHVWVRSAACSEQTPGRRRVVVLYIHGGGFIVLSPRLYIPFACELQHRVSERLSDKLGPDADVSVEILLANYRKLPEYPHPVPVLDAVAMYDYLTKELNVSPENIIVAGDSAGGNLALATMLRVRDREPAQLPLAGFVLCPFVDLERLGDERKAPYCVLGDKASQGIFDVYHPREGDPSMWGDASPVHCDLRGLPPVYIQAAELDYILPHSKRLMEKAKADGVKGWELEIFHNVPHVFTNFPASILPTASRGIDAISEFTATRFADLLRAAVAY